MDNCCQDKGCELEALQARQSRVLWIVLGINGFMFLFELAAGWLAGSVALQADSLDMLGDTLVYGFSLYAIAKSARWRSGAALLKGGIMGVFGVGVLIEAGYKLLNPEVPSFGLMGVVSLLALAANATCLYLLTRHRSDDLNMRSTWLCSRNDIVANTGVFLAAGLVYLTGSVLPDIAISLVITALFLRSAAQVLQAAIAEWRLSPNAVQPAPR